jgi:hypothetical protein
MGVPQNDAAMPFAQARQFLAQRIVVRLPVPCAPLVALAGVGGLARQVQRLLAEGVHRQQAGDILPRVQALVLRRAVQVDDMAGEVRRQHRRAHRPGELVQPRQVPVDIGALQGRRRHAALERVRDERAGVRERHQQRCRAPAQCEEVRCHA